MQLKDFIRALQIENVQNKLVSEYPERGKKSHFISLDIFFGKFLFPKPLTQN